MAKNDEGLKKALATILYGGLLAMRGTAGRDYQYVAIEATHLHNLPWFLSDPTEGGIRYYFDATRSAYRDNLKHLGGESARLAPDYSRQWRVIRAWLHDRDATPRLATPSVSSSAS